jgi:hypothetical protein
MDIHIQNNKVCTVVFSATNVYFVVYSSRGMRRSVLNLCDHMGVSYTNVPLWKY